MHFAYCNLCAFVLYYNRQGERKDNPGKPNGERVQVSRGDAHKPLKKCEKPLDKPPQMCYTIIVKGIENSRETKDTVAIASENHTRSD